MFKRICPQCNNEIVYKVEKNFIKACNINSVCIKCAKLKYDYSLYSNNLRNCPNCNEIIKYSRILDKIYAIKNNTFCKKCSDNKGKFCNNHKKNDLYNISKNDLKNILLETTHSFYWLGFIIADGCLNKNSFELQLSIKDIDHLKKFSKFINYNKEIKLKKQSNSCRIYFSDRFSVSELKNKYNIQDKKTYNPINFDYFKNYNEKLLLSLLIGIIDGDGYIGEKTPKNSMIISIVSHKKWFLFFQNLFYKLNLENVFKIYEVKNTNKIVMNLYKKDFILFFSKFVEEENLPVLTRKWNKIKNEK